LAVTGLLSADHWTANWYVRPEAARSASAPLRKGQWIAVRKKHTGRYQPPQHYARSPRAKV